MTLHHGIGMHIEFIITILTCFCKTTKMFISVTFLCNFIHLYRCHKRESLPVSELSTHHLRLLLVSPTVFTHRFIDTDGIHDLQSTVRWVHTPYQTYQAHADIASSYRDTYIDHFEDLNITFSFILHQILHHLVLVVFCFFYKITVIKIEL